MSAGSGLALSPGMTVRAKSASPAGSASPATFPFPVAEFVQGAARHALRPAAPEVVATCDRLQREPGAIHRIEVAELDAAVAYLEPETLVALIDREPEPGVLATLWSWLPEPVATSLARQAPLDRVPLAHLDPYRPDPVPDLLRRLERAGRYRERVSPAQFERWFGWATSLPPAEELRALRALRGVDEPRLAAGVLAGCTGVDDPAAIGIE